MQPRKEGISPDHSCGEQSILLRKSGQQQPKVVGHRAWTTWKQREMSAGALFTFSFSLSKTPAGGTGRRWVCTLQPAFSISSLADMPRGWFPW